MVTISFFNLLCIHLCEIILAAEVMLWVTDNRIREENRKYYWFYIGMNGLFIVLVIIAILNEALMLMK